MDLYSLKMGEEMKRFYTIVLFVMICSFINSKPIYSCGGGCSAYDIGEAKLPYSAETGHNMDCPGTENAHCCCTGMATREFGGTQMATMLWFNAWSVYCDWIYANIATNSGHIMNVNNYEGSDVPFSNASLDGCYNRSETGEHITEWWGTEPKLY
jgi:hypothetical protein